MNTSMKNILIVFYLLIGYVSIASSQETETTKIRRKAISSLNIQFAKTYEYTYKFGEIDKMSVFLNTIKKFNKKGNAIEDLFFYKENDYKEKYSYEYDSNNNLIKIINKNADGTIKGLTKYFYINGLQKEEYKYFCDGSLSKKYVYDYDSTKRVIGYKCEDIDIFGFKKKFNSTYTYTDNGEKIQYIFYSNGDLNCYYRASNLPNNCICTEFVNNNKQVINITLEYLNKLGQDTLTKIIVSGTGITTKTVKKYNSKNLFVQCTTYENDEPTLFVRTEYIKFKPYEPTPVKPLLVKPQVVKPPIRSTSSTKSVSSKK